MPRKLEKKKAFYWQPTNHKQLSEWVVGCYLELVILSIIFFFTFFTAHTTQIPYFGHYYTCPFKEMTGLSCPGCGITRAFIAIGHADFIEALKNNPLVFIFFPIFLLRFIQRLQEIFFKRFYVIKFNGNVLLFIATFFISFGIIRMILQIFHFMPVI